MTPFSILDLAPITEGGDVATALRNARDLAQHAERWGYRRYWLAEHHGMPGIASAATAVVIGHVAAGTSTIRVGAGGIMLPNHAPLVVAEQFGTLASLFPGRIDLGLGRAPGTDHATARALRRNLASDVDQFPDDVLELMAYFEPAEPGQVLRAVPGEGQQVPVWILGSSLYGAQLAAALGLPYAFASHFAPAQMLRAIEVYRERFRPSAALERPYVMLGCNVFAADTDAEIDAAGEQRRERAQAERQQRQQAERAQRETATRQQRDTQQRERAQAESQQRQKAQQAQQAQQAQKAKREAAEREQRAQQQRERAPGPQSMQRQPQAQPSRDERQASRKEKRQQERKRALPDA